MRYIALILMLIAPSWAWGASSNIPDTNATLEKIGPVRVRVLDQAEGGCWTNIGEAQIYALDQLALIGIKSEITTEVSFSGQGSNFLIKVQGFRNSLGSCVGAIEVRTDALVEGQAGIWGVIMYSFHESLHTEPKNLNISVLNSIKKAIKDWGDQ